MSVFGAKIDLEPLEKRIRALEDLCHTLDSKSRSLNLEYTELYDKVSHQMSRMARRYATDKKANGEETPAEAGDSPGDSLDPISKSIMLRRGMGALNK